MHCVPATYRFLYMISWDQYSGNCTQCLAMSLNSKYYCSKIRKKDANNCKTLEILFKNTNFRSSSTSVRPDLVDVSYSEAINSGTGTIPETGSSNFYTSVSSELPYPSGSTTDESDYEPPSKVSDRSVFDSMKYESHFKWFFYSVGKKGYSCKYYELLPFLSEEGTSKWGEVGVQLGTHPTRKLEKHQSSVQHRQASEGSKGAQKTYILKSTKSTSVIQQLKDKSSRKEVRNRTQPGSVKETVR